MVLNGAELYHIGYSTLPSRTWTKKPDSHYKKRVDLQKQLQYSLDGTQKWECYVYETIQRTKETYSVQ